jgi:hypothetical protein
MPSGSTLPNEVRRDAVPNEARDASLTLGRTIKKDARQDKVGETFLNSLTRRRLFVVTILKCHI